MEQGDKDHPAADAVPPARKPWSPPVLIELDVVGNTYGQRNVKIDDDGFTGPS